MSCGLAGVDSSAMVVHELFVSLRNTKRRWFWSLSMRAAKNARIAAARGVPNGRTATTMPLRWTTALMFSGAVGSLAIAPACALRGCDEAGEAMPKFIGTARESGGGGVLGLRLQGRQAGRVQKWQPASA